MRERVKEQGRDIRFARTKTSALSEHATEMGHIPIWSKVKFIDYDPHCNTRRVKEAIHIKLHPGSINRDSGIDIPQAWIPTIKQHNSRLMRTYEGTHLTAGIIMRIEMHQYKRINRMMKTSSIAVKTSRSTSKVTLSWDKWTKFISNCIILSRYPSFRYLLRDRKLSNWW